jgi:hypothetical protein
VLRNVNSVCELQARHASVDPSYLRLNRDQMPDRDGHRFAYTEMLTSIDASTTIRQISSAVL